MNTAALIEQANKVGIMLALNGDRLAWSASKETPSELLTQLREDKAQIIEHLRRQQLAWLDRVAALLDTSASPLLERGLIDLDDLAEQYCMQPRFAARLIESNPVWQRGSLVRDEVRAPSSREVRTHCVPPEVNKGNTSSRESSASKRRATEWLAARDAFHSHAVGHCHECYPPTGSYCPTGLDFLALYQKVTQ
ncbi:MAG: TubC N-terminal docking domain-related protein [Pseudomonadales bacterium]